MRHAPNIKVAPDQMQHRCVLRCVERRRSLVWQNVRRNNVQQPLLQNDCFVSLPCDRADITRSVAHECPPCVSDCVKGRTPNGSELSSDCRFVLSFSPTALCFYVCVALCLVIGGVRCCVRAVCLRLVVFARSVNVHHCERSCWFLFHVPRCWK